MLKLKSPSLVCLSAYLAFTFFRMGIVSHVGWFLLFFPSLLLAGKHKRLASLLMLLGWSYLILGTYPAGIPSDPYIGWILLALILPESEKDFLKQGFFFVVGASLFISGLSKMESPSWLNGEAISLASRSYIGSFVKIHPGLVSCFLTWGFLAWEFVFLPMSFFQKTRQGLAASMIVMNGGAFFLFDIKEVSVAMVIVGLYLYEKNHEIGRDF